MTHAHPCHQRSYLKLLNFTIKIVIGWSKKQTNNGLPLCFMWPTDGLKWFSKLLTLPNYTDHSMCEREWGGDPVISKSHSFLINNRNCFQRVETIDRRPKRHAPHTSFSIIATSFPSLVKILSCLQLKMDLYDNQFRAMKFFSPYYRVVALQ